MKKQIFTIGIEELKISCIIGVLPEERVKKQEIVVDIEIKKRLPKTFSDDLSSSVDYRIFAEIAQELALNKYYLIESFANDLAEALLQKTGAESIKVSLKKKSAIREASVAFTYLTRERK